MRASISKLSLVFVPLLLAACSFATQTTSGRDWLASSPPRTVDMTPGSIDQAVRDAANVEPTLRFPARVGIARIDHGRLSAIRSDEVKAWEEAAARLGEAYGEFVPVSPLVAATVEPELEVGPYIKTSAREAIDEIRLASARQHLDAVIVYEVDATANSRSNPLSLADWTIIGAFVLPGQDVKAQAVAQAILLDVRNGYPYGTVRADADDKSATARFAIHDAGTKLEDRVRADAVTKLAGETEAMLRRLRPELAALDKRSR